MNQQRATVATLSARQRLRESKPLLILIGIIVACMALLLIIPTNSQDRRPFSAGNLHDEGSAALIEVLREQGVNVFVTSSPEDAIARAQQPDTTLAVAGDVVPLNFQMYTDRIDSIVWIANGQMTGPEFNGVTFAGTSQLLPGVLKPDVPATVRLLEDSTCRSEAAKRAGKISKSEVTVSVHEPWTGCFEQSSGQFVYAEKIEGDQFRAIIPGGAVVQNKTIAQADNAALALNTLGRNANLVWFVGSLNAGTTVAAPAPPMPLWLKYGILLLGLTMAMLAWVKGVRLGRLVPENLPTPVPAIETVQGRGRLLRSNRAHAHAATSLRVHTARRIARRLGVTDHSSRAALTEAIRASGVDVMRADDTLWGPAPTNDQDLARLAQELKQLEADIRHE